jgi:hypothetical protein
MRSRTTLPTLLLIVILPMFACQYLAPVPQTCRVKMPGAGSVEHRQGDEITFTVDNVDWQATVDCKIGRLVDGHPVRPARAREVMLPVEDTQYRLITPDAHITMSEYRENGSHVRIDTEDGYYVVSLSTGPASLGHAWVRYFMAGQADDGLLRIYCYNRTEGEEHSSLPVVGYAWTLERPVAVSLICSGRDFILEITSDITPLMLSQGPTPVPPTPGVAPTLEPPGSHL